MDPPPKSETDTHVARVVTDSSSNHESDATKFRSTPADDADMRRMGKDQELVRRFEVLTTASLAAVATAAWEYSVFNLTAGLTNGGLPTLVYGLIWSIVGFASIYLSMAEMASMAPIAGAQYHWVSEFAPEGWQRGLSYLTGWTSTLAWQAGNAAGVFLVGVIIQILISLYQPDYTFPGWHTTLLAMMAIVIAYIATVWGAKYLHLWQNAAFVLHISVYLAMMIAIWVNAPRASSSQVWTEFNFSGGWPNTGLAVLVGQQTGILTQIGVDTVTHISEETRNASKTIPRVLISVWLLNSFLAFTSFITIAYHLPDVEAALADPTAYPIVYVLRQAMSDKWITVILTLTLFVMVCCTITYLMTVTRDLWAFARDQGFPFSRWIAQVEKTRNIPRNAIIVTSAISGCLSLIAVGSSVAFYATASLVTVALLQCYCLSISCILWRRITAPQTLPPAAFSLGKFGIPINITGVLYACFACFWSFWPTYYAVVPETFNWASVLFTAVLIGAGVHFVFVGRRKYFGPVVHVEGRGVQQDWTGEGGVA